MKSSLAERFRALFKEKSALKNTYNIKVCFPYIEQNLYIGSEISNFIVKKISAVKYDRIIAVIDTKLYKKRKEYLDPILSKLMIVDIILMESKELNKNLLHCDKILSQLTKNVVNRKSCLLAIGGGYIGDIVGFTASVYMRGIDFIQISTTLMSMSDAIMGKVAINNNGSKNLLGSFYSPRLTFCDISLLKTTNRKDIVFGMIEIWKHALIESNLKVQNIIFEYLNGRQEYSDQILFELIKFSLNTKKKYVKDDHDDTRGLHKSLSLGHTFANYLESKIEILHGPAVFYGLILVFFISHKLKKMSDSDFKRFMEVSMLFDREILKGKEVQESIDMNDILKKLKFDKINSGDSYSFVLLKSKGFFMCKNVDIEILKESLVELKNHVF